MSNFIRSSMNKSSRVCQTMRKESSTNKVISLAIFVKFCSAVWKRSNVGYMKLSTACHSMLNGLDRAVMFFDKLDCHGLILSGSLALGSSTTLHEAFISLGFAIKKNFRLRKPEKIVTHPYCMLHTTCNLFSGHPHIRIRQA